MGIRVSGANKIRLLVLFLIILVLILFKNFTHIKLGFVQDDVVEKVSGTPVLVMVYYEALCPDSKNFVLKQLKTSFDRAPDLMEIQLIPYGKATTVIEDDEIKFSCQHGPLECEANIIHACSIEAIHNAKTRLYMIGCMIRDNMNPKEAFHKCAKENGVEAESIQKCFDSRHGSELLRLNGEVTNALRPAVSFIPTITLDGSQGRQASILKDLFSEVCTVATGGSGPPPEVCLKT